MKEEKEKTLKFSQEMKEEEHSDKTSHSVGEGVEDVGGLVKKSRDRGGLPEG
jgi:hypothetical protein